MEISQIRPLGSIEKNLTKCAKTLINEEAFSVDLSYNSNRWVEFYSRFLGSR